MKIIEGSHNIKSLVKKPVLTIGNFDGVHLGHQMIFKKMAGAAKKIGGQSVVYTFEPHPSRAVAPDVCPRLIQTTDQKMKSIAEHKINICIIEPFTMTFSHLSPKKFFDKIILKKIAPSYIIVGYDLTFGRKRMGTLEVLESLCKSNRINLSVVGAKFLGGVLISSTQIRNYISTGLIDKANKMLGHPFALSGKVVHGRGLGETLGFHTANIEPDNELIPLKGVYITKTLGHTSVTNIGFNPTFGGKDLTVETHILNFSKKLYGKSIEIMFYKRLRDEIMFESPLLLAKQIEADIYEAKKYFKI